MDKFIPYHYNFDLVCSTIELWFGKEAKDQIIEEMEWSDLVQAWRFQYRAPFDRDKIVFYYIDRDGHITFLGDE